MAKQDTQFKKGITPWNKGKRIIKICSFCVTNFSGRGVKYCSLQCAGKARLGLVFSENLGRKKGSTPYNKGKKSPETSGKNNGNWIEDRNLLVKSEMKHLDGQYRNWMFTVKNRDGWKCKILNTDCKGRLEAHHILNWKQYPELRYEVNNGITLCLAHHPRGRVNEAKLSPYLQSLVAERN